MKKDRGDIFRSFNRIKIKRKDKDNYVYTYHIVYKTIKRGEFFGRKAILSKYDLETVDIKRGNMEFKSKVTIIAKSSKVKLYNLY